MPNAYFELTEEFNRDGTVAVLSSGQAVVWYRLAIMSKDGDWVVRENQAACTTVLEVLGRHGARYRAGAPMDIEWLAGGWSSHFECQDQRGHRLRCDFVSRPPRMDPAAVEALFAAANRQQPLAVIDLPSLVAIKQTQRAKDYPVIGALARLLPPNEELRVTTDPDRVIELAPLHGRGMAREAVEAALVGRSREDVVVALAREADRLQQRDRVRVERYKAAGSAYAHAFQQLDLGSLPLAEAHPRMRDLAVRLLPRSVT